ncbi:MAG TPA: carbon storage regulator [Ruminococcaceae bacterium]|jgi:carbon storage regulator|nr:carbon storage regulator [Oscillospiraceae bacterium]
MLVVTRKTDESLIISDNIEITVLEIGKDKVKIGINAPKEIKVIRSELKDARQTNEQAAHSSGSAIAELLKQHKQEEN